MKKNSSIGNSATNDSQVLIHTPVETDRPETDDPAIYAAGAPAVFSSMNYSIKEMGLTRTAQILLKINQKDGFDCPSCAWPDPDDRRSLAEFCENGARAAADEATTKRVTSEFFKDHSIYDLSCQSDFELGQHGRLTEPMMKAPGATHYQPISWDKAFATVADHLAALPSPHAASFYTSGRTSNEAAFAYQLLVRAFGTNNLPDCSNMCHESSGLGLGEQIGIGKGTVKLDDFEHADCILVAGQNPGTNHPRMLTALEKAARRGCKIISINPLKEAGLVAFKNPQEVGGWIGRGTALSTLFLPVKINGDTALFKGLMKEMLEQEERDGPGSVLDLGFIRDFTSGFEEFSEDLRHASWREIVSESGISRELMSQTVAILRNSKSTIACWAMGLTQHKNGVANIQLIMDLLLLQGNIGRRGAGPCPVRGHSNVQGDRTMGIFEKMPDWFRDRLDFEFKMKSPRLHGFDTVETIQGMHDGRVQVFFAMGGNFLAATPDTSFTADALRRCRLTVHVSTKLNRAHLVTGETALILPCLGRTERDVQAAGEQFVTVEDSMGVVHASRGTLKAGSSHLKSEVAIVCNLAKALLQRQPEKAIACDWDQMAANYDIIRDQIEKVIPGFENFNTRVRKPGGFYLPNGPRDGRKFNTSTSKAKFVVHPVAVTSVPPGHLMLMTIRTHDQFNTTIYGLNDRYRGIHAGRRVILMNRENIYDQGLAAGDHVDITSHYEGEKRKAEHFTVVEYEIPKNCAAVYYPEGNILVPIQSMADGSRTPAYKSIVVTVERV